jgi:hypothetical protein
MVMITNWDLKTSNNHTSSEQAPRRALLPLADNAWSRISANRLGPLPVRYLLTLGKGKLTPIGEFRARGLHSAASNGGPCRVSNYNPDHLEPGT